MDMDELPVILFMCDVQSRCKKHGETRLSDYIMELHRDFIDNISKQKQGKIKLSTLNKRGSKFLARFPDLQLRFRRFMSDPRAFVHDPTGPIATTGKFNPLNSHLVLQHIVHALPYPTASRLAQCCKWLRQTISTRVLVDMRQRFEQRMQMKITGGSAPLRLVTVDDQPLALHILRKNKDHLIGMECGGQLYALSTRDILDPFQQLRVTGYTPKAFTQARLHEVLDQIARAPPGLPLDLCMWAKLYPCRISSFRIEIAVHGEYGKISRKYCDKGVKHVFEARVSRINKAEWDALVK